MDRSRGATRVMPTHILPATSDGHRAVTMDVSVIVLAKNEAAHIERCLRSIFANRTPALKEVVVVDNASTDATAEIARAEGARVVSSDSRYLGHLRNLGAENTSGALLVYVDGDCSIPEDWVETALASLSETGADAATGVIALPPDAGWVERAWLPPGKPSRGPTRKVIGAAFLCHRHVFDAVGGFDPKKSAGEDSDLGARLSDAGYRIILEPNCTVVHWGYPSTLGGMVDRQAWQVAGRSGTTPILRDPTVILSLASCMAAVTALLAALFAKWLLAFLLLILACAGPGAFLIRRVRRADAEMTVTAWTQAFVVSIAYFLGRAKGAMHRILRVPYSRSYK